MRSVIHTILFAALIAAAVYGWQNNAFDGAVHLLRPSVCERGLSYAIGTVDRRFDLERPAFAEVVAEAASVWEEGMERDLFRRASTTREADVVVDLVFDERQRRTRESKELIDRIGEVESVHTDVQQEYTRKSAEYDRLQNEYEERRATYQQELNAYNERVDKWNERGGAPPEVYEELEAQSDRLAERAAELERRRERLNELARELNALARRGNELADRYNREVVTYNERFGGSRRFEQGEYQRGTIRIFQFNEHSDLTLVLAHEFGHALGLDHVNDPQAIMHHLMGEQDLSNIHITGADRTALEAKCEV